MSINIRYEFLFTLVNVNSQAKYTVAAIDRYNLFISHFFFSAPREYYLIWLFESAPCVDVKTQVTSVITHKYSSPLSGPYADEYSTTRDRLVPYLAY